MQNPEYTVIVEKFSADEDYFRFATEVTNPGESLKQLLMFQKPVEQDVFRRLKKGT